MIKSPYCVVPNKHDRGYSISYRYTVNGEIRFKSMATAGDRAAADIITKLLNKEWCDVQKSVDKASKSA